MLEDAWGPTPQIGAWGVHTGSWTPNTQGPIGMGGQQHLLGGGVVVAENYPGGRGEAREALGACSTVPLGQIQR